MADRRVIDVPAPAGGWGAPWPNVAEIEAVLPHATWTLVGGLMTQLHAIHRGVGVIRPTNDVDIVLHVETTRGVAAVAANALESIGYQFMPSIDDRNDIAHRFTRGTSRVDLVTGATDVIDVLVADHAAPRVIERLRGKRMMAIEGGTQALRRTIHARLRIVDERTTTVSVPSPFGALILKAPAFQTDSVTRNAISRTRRCCCPSSRTPTSNANTSPDRTGRVSPCWRRRCSLTEPERGGRSPLNGRRRSGRAPHPHGVTLQQYGAAGRWDLGSSMCQR